MRDPKQRRLFSGGAIRGVLLLLIVGMLALAALPLQAQEDIQLASLRVGLWPEYDRTSLLVIYWGELVDGLSYPLTLNLRMPASVPAPFVVAAQAAPDAAVDEVDYTSSADGAWRIVTFTVGGPQFQFEYYTDLPRDGAARDMTYVWPGDYAVEQLVFEVQRPPGTDDFVMMPQLPDSQVNANNSLIYYGGAFGPLAVDETFSLGISYTRSDDILTVEVVNAQQSSISTQSGTTGTTNTAQSSSTVDAANIVILVAVAVVSFLLGALTMRLAINRQSAER